MNTQEESNEQYYPGAVLLSDHIKKFVDNNLLIVEDTFDDHQLQRAKYNVRLGKTYFKEGDYHDLSKNNIILKIKPYELVFVESYEIFKLPENVIGKYDTRIKGCLGGIGLQTGLHIDPDYYGRFFCPLFNFSNIPLTFRFKDHLASIEFIYTTPPTSETKPFSSERQGLLSLREALSDEPGRSGLEELLEKTKDTQEILENRLKEINSTANLLNIRVDSMIGAVFQAMAFMIAILAVMAATMSFMFTADLSTKPVNIGIGAGILIAVALLVYYPIRKIIRKISEKK